MSYSEIIKGLSASCRNKVSGGHLLVIQDSTELNYQRQSSRIRPETGLGVVGNNSDLGFFLHPSLVVDADHGHCIGISDVQVWTRRPDHADKNERQYGRRPIESKESYRWLSSALNSKRVLHRADRITSIQDREGDCYESFARLPDESTELLIRSRVDRRIKEGDGKLYEHLTSGRLAGVYQIDIRRDLRRSRPFRRATLEVRYARVHILCPPKLRKYGYPEAIAVCAVEARESDETAPSGGERVHWRLLTTHQVDSYDDAMRIVRWYRQRWSIEQLFRLLKKQGMNLESSELTAGTALIRQCLLSLGAVVRVLQLLLAREGDNSQPIDQAFDTLEQRYLTLIGSSYEGKTVKQQNPYPSLTIQWAFWIIARIGGWKGYARQHPAGPVTLFDGIEKFNVMLSGWQLAHKAGQPP